MLLGFKERFTLPIQIGTKVFTLRGKRKIEPKIGETLYMYSGLRTKKTKLISNKEKLISKQKVNLLITRLAKGNGLKIKISVDGKFLTEKQINEFIKFDGFTDIFDFSDYWIKSSTGKNDKTKTVRVGGLMTMYHWTDLRF